jgi:hypothetical protein
VNEATNIEDAREPGVEVTAPNGSGQEQRGRTLDCSALTPDGTHHSAPSHQRAGSKRKCEWKRGKRRSPGGLCLCFGHHVDLDEGGLLMEAIWEGKG